MKVFLTGYPGFIGGRIVSTLAARHPQATFVLLVQERMQDEARRRLRGAGLGGRAELVVGDLAEPGLGLAPHALRGVTHVWHLAAIYDLAVERQLAEKVNVQGTLHLLDACEGIEGLQRLIYFSTCYVAGQREGRVYEADLDVGQRFHNHYESTKFYAEVEVRKRLERIPTVIVRPAVVVGDSHTGETDKYDGPYYIFGAMARAPKWLPLPMIGPGTSKLNIVPVDFIVDASVALSEMDEAVGLTFHLADPSPLPFAELIDEIAAKVGRRGPLGRLPKKPVDALMRSKAVRRVLGVPRETVTYVDYPVEFDTANTQRLLEPVGVACPPLRSYLPALLAYMAANPRKVFLDGRAL